MSINPGALINITDPSEVLGEVQDLTGIMFPEAPLVRVAPAFSDMVNLFYGAFPGYQACTTQYHNLKHTTDVILATVRLIHGAIVEKEPLDAAGVETCLLAAMLHDVGYIQEEGDEEGTGAKYTKNHVARSMAFAEKYMSGKGFSEDMIHKCQLMISGTALINPFAQIPFPDEQSRLLGGILASADLLGQMADRAYLEKLLFLYYEFREGDIGGYEKEFDILKKSIGFYEMTKKRLAEDLGGVARYMRPHFRERKGIDRDLYSDSIEKNINYLQGIISADEARYRDFLRRDGIVDNLVNGTADNP